MRDDVPTLPDGYLLLRRMNQIFQSVDLKNALDLMEEMAKAMDDVVEDYDLQKMDVHSIAFTKLGPVLKKWREWK